MNKNKQIDSKKKLDKLPKLADYPLEYEGSSLPKKNRKVTNKTQKKETKIMENKEIKNINKAHKSTSTTYKMALIILITLIIGMIAGFIGSYKLQGYIDEQAETRAAELSLLKSKQ